MASSLLWQAAMPRTTPQPSLTRPPPVAAAELALARTPRRISGRKPSVRQPARQQFRANRPAAPKPPVAHALARPGTPSRCVVYAVDDSLLHLFYLSKSLETLRHHNATLSPKVFLYAPWTVDRSPPSHRPLLRAIREAGAEILERPPTPLPHPTFVKWLPLAEIASDTVLLADTDTLFFADPEHLFDRYARREFYARREAGTEPGHE